MASFYPNLLRFFSLSHVTAAVVIALLKVVLNWNDRLKSFVHRYTVFFEHCIVSHDFGHHFIIDDHHAGEEASITGKMFNFPIFTQIFFFAKNYVYI